LVRSALTWFAAISNKRQKSHHVRLLNVPVERCFVFPARVNLESSGSAVFFVEVNLSTARLSASPVHQREKFAAQLVSFSRLGVKADKRM
jgi:hypothetical protein